MGAVQIQASTTRRVPSSGCHVSCLELPPVRLFFWPIWYDSPERNPRLMDQCESVSFDVVILTYTNGQSQGMTPSPSHRTEIPQNVVKILPVIYCKVI